MNVRKTDTLVKQAQPGDVFKIPLNDGTEAYAQFLMLDLESLNSEVLRVFEKIYSADEAIELSEIVTDTVAFYAHTVIKNGIKDGTFVKVGNVKLDHFQVPYFRNDRSMEKYYPGKVSDEWYVWKTGELAEKIGKLTAEYKKLDVGSVYPPSDIVYRLHHGKSEFVDAD